MKSRVDGLVRNIDHYRATASKIEESVSHLGRIQREVKQLNREGGIPVD